MTSNYEILLSTSRITKPEFDVSPSFVVDTATAIKTLSANKWARLYVKNYDTSYPRMHCISFKEYASDHETIDNTMTAIPLLRAIGFNIYSSNHEDIAFFISTEKLTSVWLESTGPIINIEVFDDDEYMSPEDARLQLLTNPIAKGAYDELQELDENGFVEFGDDTNEDSEGIAIDAIRIFLALGYCVCNTIETKFTVYRAMKKAVVSEMECHVGYWVL